MDDSIRESTNAKAELQALAALIERPPLDDVLLTQDVALRAAAAIHVITATPVVDVVGSASSGTAVGQLIQWAQKHQAFVEGTSGGSGRGHIDENQRFVLRDILARIEANANSLVCEWCRINSGAGR